MKQFVCLLSKAELDLLTVQYDQADVKALALGKQCTALESQLAEVQHTLHDETQEKLAVMSRLRQTEEHAANLNDQLEEDQEVVKQLEVKVNAQNLQVSQSAHSFFLRISVHGIHYEDNYIAHPNCLE